MRVATYNICHGRYAGINMQKIADIIGQTGADVVALQEVDQNTGRVGGRDLLRELSERSGYAHAAFCPAMPFEGGYYGTAVLSRVPIDAPSSVRYTRPGREPRTYSRCEVTLDDCRLAFYNTHCANKEADVRRAQQAELSAILLREPLPYIAAGDYNDSDFSLFSSAGIRMVNGDGRRFETYPAGSAAIDNLLFSRALTLLDAGVIDSPLSDHLLLWGEFSF